VPNGSLPVAGVGKLLRLEQSPNRYLRMDIGHTGLSNYNLKIILSKKSAFNDQIVPKKCHSALVLQFS
jgi:hypothetical protein